MAKSTSATRARKNSDKGKRPAAKTKARPKAAKRADPQAALGKKRRQTFTVSHPRKTDFRAGLRRYARYRDLGIAAATQGLVQAHVIRMIPPFRAEEVSTPHYHDVAFQMIYVLKGWYKTAFAGQGTHTFRKGACWIQPPRIAHTVLGYSKDCELLEIIMPADFDTVTLDKRRR